MDARADDTGSAWSEYKKSQTVHGISMPAGLVESEKLPKPIFTPSTKADQGEHDENIHPDKGGLPCYSLLLDWLAHTLSQRYLRCRTRSTD